MTDDLTALRAFAKDVITFWPASGIDGDDLQSLAVKHGLLAPEKRFAACADTCLCAEYCNAADFAAGVQCFRQTELLRGAP